MNHFAKVCRSALLNKQTSFGNISSADDSDIDEPVGRIIVRNLEEPKESRSLTAKIVIGSNPRNGATQNVELLTDTGISKTLLNSTDWLKIKPQCRFVRTSKCFRPYGTAYHLPIKGRAHVFLKAENGAEIDTWIYVVNSTKEQSLLGNTDAERLGIVTINLQGSNEEIVRNVTYMPKTLNTADTDQNPELQTETDIKMQRIVEQFPSVFSNTTGKFRGSPIKIQIKSDATPVIQSPHRIPLQYVDRTKKELEKMLLYKRTSSKDL